MIYSILEILIIIIPLLGSIAFMTLAERKIMGSLKIIYFVYSLFHKTRNS
jgi:NADH:ubiquinone oxidoreductase subunit H